MHDRWTPRASRLGWRLLAGAWLLSLARCSSNEAAPSSGGAAAGHSAGDGGAGNPAGDAALVDGPGAGSAAPPAEPVADDARAAGGDGGGGGDGAEAGPADGAGAVNTSEAAAEAGSLEPAEAGQTPCAAPQPGELVGWASMNGGTTGGGATPPVITTTAAEFTSAIAGKTARVVHVKGSFKGVFSIGSNKTIVGLCGARLQGHVSLSGATNVIVRNLTIVGNNCADSPNDCSGGADAVTIGDSSRNVWFDHCDVSDGSDGNMDITSGADFVTVSFCKFHYSTARSDPTAGASGHRFSNLIGSADDVPGDVGRLNVTFHHDWWAEHVDQRMPRTRHGQIHVLNNLFTAVGNNYCTNAGYQASVVVENNVYLGVNNPLKPDANGDMVERGNVFSDTTGSASASPSGHGFTPPYPYQADEVGALEARVRREAGPH